MTTSHRFKGGSEKLLHIETETLAIDGAVEEARRVDAVAAQGGEEGRGFPLACGTLSMNRSPRGASREGASCWSWPRSYR